MKLKNHQETHRTIEETPSNNRDTNKIDTEVCDLKASIQGLFLAEASKHGLLLVAVGC